MVSYRMRADTLVDGGVSREAVDVAFAIDIPYEGALSTFKDNGTVTGSSIQSGL